MERFDLLEPGAVDPASLPSHWQRSRLRLVGGTPPWRRSPEHPWWRNDHLVTPDDMTGVIDGHLDDFAQGFSDDPRAARRRAAMVNDRRTWHPDLRQAGRPLYVDGTLGILVVWAQRTHRWVAVKVEQAGRRKVEGLRFPIAWFEPVEFVNVSEPTFRAGGQVHVADAALDMDAALEAGERWARELREELALEREGWGWSPSAELPMAPDALSAVVEQLALDGAGRRRPGDRRHVVGE